MTFRLPTKFTLHHTFPIFSLLGDRYGASFGGEPLFVFGSSGDGKKVLLPSREESSIGGNNPSLRFSFLLVEMLFFILDSCVLILTLLLFCSTLGFLPDSLTRRNTTPVQSAPWPGSYLPLFLTE
jgi:hypothetical protein